MPPPESTHLAVYLVAAFAAFACGCSLVVESQDRQCERDADCSGFASDAVCDVAGGVCVPRGATATTAGTGTAASSVTSSGTGAGGAGGGCVGPEGCFACAPTAQVELLNACTDAECIPYDNAQIADLLEADGSVPPVP